MYPQQPTPPPYQPTPPPYQPPAGPPIDYLNQIAPQTPPRSPVSKVKKLIIFGLLAVIVVIIISITMNAITGAQRAPAQTLAARLTETQKIADDSQDKLKSSELRSFNSDLRIYFTNTLRDAAEPLGKADVNMKKIDGNTLKKEEAAAEKTTERLEDARLNAIFDRTYAREMAYQLETLLVLMQQVYSSTRSESLKTFLDDSYKNLQPIQQGFEEFNESTN